MVLIMIVGWSSHLLLALILALAVKRRFLTKYVIFYAYVAGLLLMGLVRFYFFALDSEHLHHYFFAYWYTQFLMVAGGYGLLWQIYGHILRPYPGAAKVARVMVSSFLALIWLQLCISVMAGQGQEFTNSIVRFERDVQSVQAVLVIALLLLVRYYGIPLGKNMQGLLVGYGLFIATRLAILTLQSFWGASFYFWRYYAEPISFLATITVWSMAFRSYDPNPVPEQEVALERDYQLLARQTLRAITRTSSYLSRALLP